MGRRVFQAETKINFKPWVKENVACQCNIKKAGENNECKLIA